MTDLSKSMNVERFSTIQLGELVEEVGLLRRVDRKYVISDSTLHLLLRALTNNCSVLQIDGLTHFRYRSVYFDDTNRSSYTGAAHRRRRRFKVRTRTYCDSALCMVEVKVRGPRSNTIKTRQPHDQSPYELSGSENFVRQELDGRADPEQLIPTLENSYVRTTLAHLEEGARITIDRGLSARLLGPERRLHFPNVNIVETKSSGPKTIADNWLWANGIRPSKVSKYGTVLAMLDTQLPANKWRRTIQHLTSHACFEDTAVLETSPLARQRS